VWINYLSDLKSIRKYQQALWNAAYNEWIKKYARKRQKSFALINTTS
jgi:hypothetical protein